MKKITSAAFLFLLIFLFLSPNSHFAQSPIKDLKPTVILISLDGFRYDYFEKFQPKFLNQLAKKGVRAKWMIPSFPTKTFPNHYTVATGLYPAHHGIVENNVYDFGTTFSMSKRKEVQNPRWWLGEPIWVTAEKQNQNSAAFFFPGTETKIGGVKPQISNVYNGKVPPEFRVDKILSYLDLPAEKRPTMLTLYFSDVDDAGHEFSPDAEETRYAVHNVDRYIEQLYNGLKQRKIDKKVNVIITSDHGMASYKVQNAIFLDDYFSDKLAEKILWTNEFIQIFPKDGKTNEIFGKINNIKNLNCWNKKDIPARFNYQDSPRIAPIICLADEGWIVTNHKRYDDWLDDIIDVTKPRGAHGYDNNLTSMRAIFLAHGEAFKRNYVAEPFENIQVYNLMCKILGLNPAKNDGDFEKVKSVLR